ncbi:hypothetical protein CJA_0305 [Cellvibrio japonicus Ueda107]|uniref:MipA/OmpV family protein n=2 Tax=Cellvibrio japonicus TaxID=155077 RepID=B3PHA8_CELJU|nr:hypothetical protein CJA_0305 [Cellvibrio japonicus Ueda107]
MVTIGSWARMAGIQSCHYTRDKMHTCFFSSASRLSRLFLRQFSLLMVMVPSTYAQDEHKTWELGVGLGALYGPDYRGADEYRSYVAPIPYIVYRGKFIQSDRDGLRGNVVRSDTYEFTLSASANITPDSEKNRAREGMPELGSTAELGPSLNLLLMGENLQEGLQLQIPWRFVFALHGDKRGYIGQVLQPQLMWRQRIDDWSLSYRAGITLATEPYHHYYYGVDERYATGTRPAYTTDSGYSGWFGQLAVSHSLRIINEQTRLALFMRYDNLAQSTMEDSPLLFSKNAWRGGLAFIWVIH